MKDQKRRNKKKGYSEDLRLPSTFSLLKLLDAGQGDWKACAADWGQYSSSELHPAALPSVQQPWSDWPIPVLSGVVTGFYGS